MKEHGGRPWEKREKHGLCCIGSFRKIERKKKTEKNRAAPNIFQSPGASFSIVVFSKSRGVLGPGRAQALPMFI